MNTTDRPDAGRQDGTYPRPQLVRNAWRDLTGTWEFAYGSVPDEEPGSIDFERTIEVPFPPESPASGIGETGFHPVVWYRRTFDRSDLIAAGLAEGSPRTILRFGAVDYVADVWLNGRHLGRHQGGQTPFHFDITSSVRTDAPNELVVRALDDPLDVEVPRGKQDWHEDPHAIWYHRTTGIWQPVWLECVPELHVTALAWQSDTAQASVDLELVLNARPASGTTATVRVDFEGELLAQASVALLDVTSHVTIAIPRQRNGQQYQELLWSPEHPRLLDASIVVETDDGDQTDAVASYLGLRTVATDGRHLLLNDRPLYLRAVLSQNYWPESHLAAPSAEALKSEVELILSLGFNAARVHQKAEDPRFLYWADRLGLLIWGETASAYEFSPRAVQNQVTEWTDIVLRDRSHPAVIAWVPLNESWGVQQIAHDPRQQAFSRGIADLTRALDGTRPVISNDGWEHTRSDLLTIHDYDGDPESLARRYASEETIAELTEGMGPAGRLLHADAGDHGCRTPVLLTEFGGTSWNAAPVDGSWGYNTATSADDFLARVTSIVKAATSSPVLAGFCYTQLTDTGQETNGLVTESREPKAPLERLRAAITGCSDR
ncbi:glycoside hydrolase family 2 protein [Gryllotalpicola koreensis]|uniref:Glycoside hydrolase family 2 TIM barrel-domain containing protein n=1 Tax=Gryllotalpicola koreensis TaxID=993086 RepID=A0ABP8A0G3_9MICO